MKVAIGGRGVPVLFEQGEMAVRRFQKRNRFLEIFSLTLQVATEILMGKMSYSRWSAQHVP